MALAVLLALYEELQEILYAERNFMRLERYRLRDAQNPFEIPTNNFIQLYRLPKDFVIDVIMPKMEPVLGPSGANPMAIPTSHMVKHLHFYICSIYNSISFI
jgi:hypothetical protein